MILDIVENINPEKLDYAISQIGKKDISYIIMNSTTRRDLAINNPDVVSYQAPNLNSYSKYKGIPIAVFDGMRYGSVHIVTEIKCEHAYQGIIGEYEE